MNEEQQINSMQLGGNLRQSVLERVKKQFHEWKLSTPPVKPLILDFGLGRFKNVGLVEYWIANEIKAGYCGKYLFLFDGQQCPFHSHREKHESFFIVKGSVRMVVDGVERVLREGDILSMPPGRVHSFTGIGNTLVLELSMPCVVNDNSFQDPAIAEWLHRTVT